MKRLAIVLSLMGALLIAPCMATADTAKTLMDAGSHGRHSQEFTGKLTLFRTQMKGMEIGGNGDMLDAEVLVTLDSAPDFVFGVRYHEQEPSTGAIVDTLRSAFLNDLTVTIQTPRAPGRKHLRINWVQLVK